MSRAFFVLLLLLAPPLSAQVRFDRPQAKVNWVDVSDAPAVRIHVSFLDNYLRPVGLKEVKKIEVKQHDGGRGRGEVVRSFVERIPEGEGDGEVILFSKAEEARDVVIVAVGHQDRELRAGDLGSHHRAALATFFKKLGPKDRVGVIWYNDRLRTYVARKGKMSELADLSDELAGCHEKALDAYERWGEPPEEPAEGEEESGPADPCGLLEDYGRLAKIVKGEPFQGFYPQLLGFEALDTCGVRPEHGRIGADRPGARRERRGGERRPAHGGAIDEAFRMLVQKGEPARPKLLVILSDGKNGYLYAQDDCRLRYADDAKKAFETSRAACRAQGRGRVYRECMSGVGKSRSQRQAAAESKLTQRLVLEQQRFRDERLQQWLALAEAAHIQVHTVGYPTGRPHELERLELLSLRTGGTYREAAEANDIQDMVNSLLDELSNQYVVTFDAGLTPGQESAFSVRLQLRASGGRGGGSFASEPFPVVVPVAKGGLGYFARAKVRWLEHKVGSPWHIVILVVAGLLALLLLFLFLKLVVGLVKKIVKKGAKQAAGAAKQGRAGALAAARARARR